MMYNLYFIFYTLLIFITLDRVDMKIWKTMTFNGNANIVYENYEESIGKKPNKLRQFIFRLMMMIYPLVHPLVLIHTALLSNYKNKYELLKFIINKPYAHPILQMSLHGSINLLNSKQCNDTCNKYNSKIFWDNLFKKYEIHTPKIYGYVKNGNIKMTSEINNTKCILKPISGGFGNGIIHFNKNNLPRNGEFIIQEFIQTNGHYRVVTGCDHILSMRYYSKSKNEIASNYHNGGSCHVSSCKKGVCIFENIKTNKKFKMSDDIFKKIKNDALKIHKNLKEIDIIGWDIVISGNDYYFLEGNIFAGAANPHEKGYVKNAKHVLKCVKLNN